MKAKSRKILTGTISCVAVAVLLGLAITGWQTGWGPFSWLFKGYDSEAATIEKKYPVADRQHEIIFYGASNFRLWAEMETDLNDFKVQNHGFGGSTDKLLVEYADRLLYPYVPDIVFVQTGSNDYVNLSGTDEEKVQACMEYKEQMFEIFHEQLPNAKFVVMSGLLLPGRNEYTQLTQMINEKLRKLCQAKDYLCFVDASAMTFNGVQYAEKLFVSDGIHLNHEGQLLWCNNYIRPILEELTTDPQYAHLKTEG